MVKISVIMPIYKVENYLKKCIDSYAGNKTLTYVAKDPENFLEDFKL